jgi:hypothetical protein
MAVWRAEDGVWRTSSTIIASAPGPQLALLEPSVVYVSSPVSAAAAASDGDALAPAPAPAAPSRIRLMLQNLPLNALLPQPAPRAASGPSSGSRWQLRASFQGTHLASNLSNSMAYVAEEQRLSVQVLVVEVRGFLAAWCLSGLIGAPFLHFFWYALHQPMQHPCPTIHNTDGGGNIRFV